MDALDDTPRPALQASGSLSLLLSLLAGPASAALESGAYQTPPGATAQESGDRVPGNSRVVPWFGTLTFDFSASEPALSAVITNAVLEGGEAFTLIVRSSSAARLADGSYRFMGDYLGEVYPSGTQYYFDWTFSNATNGEVLWNGGAGWAGGHAWYVTVSNIALVEVPWLNITPASTASAQILWSTNFPGHVLEYAASLSAADWSAVTNPVTGIGGRLLVTVDTRTSNRFFRLRKP